jgi:hypothetical protein
MEDAQLAMMRMDQMMSRMLGSFLGQHEGVFWHAAGPLDGEQDNAYVKRDPERSEGGAGGRWWGAAGVRWPLRGRTQTSGTGFPERLFDGRGDDI